jgi:hypothetical protein
MLLAHTREPRGGLQAVNHLQHDTAGREQAVNRDFVERVRRSVPIIIRAGAAAELEVDQVDSRETEVRKAWWSS